MLLESCHRLLRLALQWATILRGQDAGDTARDGAAALTLDLPRLEGCGLCLLCHQDTEVGLTD